MLSVCSLLNQILCVKQNYVQESFRYETSPVCFLTNFSNVVQTFFALGSAFTPDSSLAPFEPSGSTLATAKDLAFCKKGIFLHHAAQRTDARVPGAGQLILCQVASDHDRSLLKVF